VSISLPELDVWDGEIKSTFRDRSKSPSRSGRSEDHSTLGVAPGGLASSWWGEKQVARSWQDEPKRKKTLPADHAVALEDTRKVSSLF